jgi:hypothetical protein
MALLLQDWIKAKSTEQLWRETASALKSREVRADDNMSGISDLIDIFPIGRPMVTPFHGMDMNE